jgi:Co/Zn/Cd efflux system component
MKGCCAPGIVEDRQRRVLSIVLVLNAAMFIAEFGAGLLAHSTALLADSLDMLGDALMYGFSLYVLGRGARWQASAALLKGGVMAAFGLGVLAELLVKVVRGVVPVPPVMGLFGMLALGVNLLCLMLLLRHRGDDVNMRSAWVCSRNDVLANVGVLAAAAGVTVTGAAWPDITVGAIIGLVFGVSATSVITEAIGVARARRLGSGMSGDMGAPAARDPVAK